VQEKTLPGIFRSLPHGQTTDYGVELLEEKLCRIICTFRFSLPPIFRGLYPRYVTLGGFFFLVLLSKEV
jgi:hypothetical protein